MSCTLPQTCTTLWRRILVAFHPASMRTLADWQADPALPGATARRKALEYAMRHGRAGLLHANGDYTEYRCPWVNAQVGQRRRACTVRRFLAAHLTWI